MEYASGPSLLDKPSDGAALSYGSVRAPVWLAVRGSREHPLHSSLEQLAVELHQRYPDELSVWFASSEDCAEPKLFLNGSSVEPDALEGQVRLWLAPRGPDWSALFSLTRRSFLGASAAGLALLFLGSLSGKASAQNRPRAEMAPSAPEKFLTRVRVKVNGGEHDLRLDSRTSTLDMLRNHLGLTGSKLGCNHGQCGACTVLLDDERVNACLLLAVQTDGCSLTTVEGLAKGEELHPLQEAFLRHDGFQCGYCTPGQLCSAVGMINEGRARTREEIRESMSGNLCRCGAHRGIIEAIQEVVG